jgi:hypothetical protein
MQRPLAHWPFAEHIVPFGRTQLSPLHVDPAQQSVFEPQARPAFGQAWH